MEAAGFPSNFGNNLPYCAIEIGILIALKTPNLTQCRINSIAEVKSVPE
jgi:hypothetical protein